MGPKTKKYLVLSILFILPITAYVFFSLSTNMFRPLPVLTENVSEISTFSTLDGRPVALENRITILGFFGEDLEAHRAYAYNLAHKIYGKYHAFKDFQVVILLPNGAQELAAEIEQKLKKIAPTDSWSFAFGTKEDIRKVFLSLNSDFVLQDDLSTPYIFIIDKERNLRGRNDDDDNGVMYGFDSSNIAEINNKMSDDVKVLLVEYRKALKKYGSKRQI